MSGYEKKDILLDLGESGEDTNEKQYIFTVFEKIGSDEDCNEILVRWSFFLDKTLDTIIKDAMNQGGELKEREVSLPWIENKLCYPIIVKVFRQNGETPYRWEFNNKRDVTNLKDKIFSYRMLGVNYIDIKNLL